MGRGPYKRRTKILTPEERAAVDEFIARQGESDETEDSNAGSVRPGGVRGRVDDQRSD